MFRYYDDDGVGVGGGGGGGGGGKLPLCPPSPWIISILQLLKRAQVTLYCSMWLMGLTHH